MGAAVVSGRAKEFQHGTLALQYSRLKLRQRYPTRRSLPGTPQFSRGLHLKYRNVAGHVGGAVIAHPQFLASDTQSGFLHDLTAQRLFFCFFPVCESSGERESASVVSFNDQELLVALDDGDGCAQSSEQRQPAVQSLAGTRHNPEQRATQVFKGRQRQSLARETRAGARATSLTDHFTAAAFLGNISPMRLIWAPTPLNFSSMFS